MTLPATVLPFASPVSGMPEPTTVTVIRGNDNTLRQRINTLRDYVGQDTTPIVTVTADTIIAASDMGGTWLVDATAAGRTITLPTAASSAGRRIIVKKIDASANVVTVDANGAETIDGTANYLLTVQYQSVTVQSNGTAWWVL